MMRVSDQLMIPKGITAVVGGGGKTSLIWRLAAELSEHAKVLLTTTTHIRLPACPTLLSPNREQIVSAFRNTNLLAVGDIAQEQKLTAVQGLNDDYHGLADYVLIEADGSRGLPLKAPAVHEPVLPAGAELTVAVAGMGCLGKTIAEAAHRSALYAELVGATETEFVTPEMVARVLVHPQGQKKGLRSRFAVVLNQTDTPERLTFAREVAEKLMEETLIVALQCKPEWAERWRCGKRPRMSRIERTGLNGRR